MKWIKVVLIIIIFELVIGGGILLYKKLAPSKEKNMIKDKQVQQLYKKIAHEDIEIIDIMEDEAKLYYGYHNIEQEQTINCDVVNITGNTKDYQCNKIAPFIPSDKLIDAVKEIYGKSVNVSLVDFKVDGQHYAFFDKQANGYVIYETTKAQDIAPINLKLKDAKSKDNQIILTTEVLDGIYGTVKESYIYTFEKGEDSTKYYLIKKEKLST